MKKPWYMSKTIWAAVVQLLLALVDGVTSGGVFGSGEAPSVILGLSGGLNILLRSITKGPIGK